MKRFRLLIIACFSFWVVSAQSQADTTISSQIQQAELLVSSLVNTVGEKDVKTAQAYKQLAKLHQSNKDFEKAITAYKKALKIYKKNKSTETKQVLYLNSDIAFNYEKLSDYKSAKQYYLENLSQAVDYYGESGIELLEAYSTLSRVCGVLQDWDEVLNYQNNSLRLAQKLFGRDDLRTVPFWEHIALTYRTQKNTKEAVATYGQILLVLKNFYNENSIQVANVNVNISQTYLEAKQELQAEKFFSKVIASVENVSDIDKYQKAGFYLLQGKMQVDLNKNKLALENLNKALAIYQQPDSVDYTPQIIACYNNMITAYSKRKKKQAAFEYIKKALVLKEKIYGDKSLAIAQSYYNYALAAMELYKYDTAIVFLQKTYDLRKDSLDKLDLEMGDLYKTFGNVYEKIGRFEDAIYNDSLALLVCKTKLGYMHKQTEKMYFELGEAYLRNGNYKKAISNFSEGGDLRSTKRTLVVSAQLRALNMEGNALWGAGKYDKALDRFEQYRSFAKTARLKSMSAYYNNVGGVLKEKGYYAAAMDTLLNSLAYFEIHQKKDSSTYIPTYSNAGDVYRIMANYRSAEDYLLKALELQLSTAGEQSIAVADINHNLALLYIDSGDSIKALDFLNKSYNQRLAVLRSNHPKLADSQIAYAKYYLLKSDFQSAMNFANKALQIRMFSLGEEHPKTGIAYSLQGNILFNQNQNQKAIEVLLLSKKILENELGTASMHTAHCYFDLALSYKSLNQFDIAMDYMKKAIVVYEANFRNIHPVLNNAYKEFSDILLKNEKYDEAALYLAKIK